MSSFILRFRLVPWRLSSGIYPGTCINAAGPEVTVADVVEGEEVDHNVSSPAAEFTLLTAKDGAAVNLWRLYPSLFRAPVNEITLRSVKACPAISATEKVPAPYI